MGFFLVTAFGPFLEPNQPLTQWVSGDLTLEIKQLGREADHLFPPSAEVKDT
jgi:hypothetical protein